ncbi:unnamed protein product [Ostreobium quekettii]|uniref:NADH dehydrogenase [ubiquinone] 1 beta subcomplex subunit 11, mitochondrial n=1 Tax=Ostreobium quekettii TaxID=121088 RepID=A0A8S1IP37_9CHLO|nr:unnamed protein product [Ostreobium quekettii]|eukprot:evm.model.scf_829.7 EVM.evm.TU.scf_829.7   scf_829:55064-56551(-)
MSLLRRLSLKALRSGQTRGGGFPGGFWADGQQTGRNGVLFGETPPPPGQQRKWESWEATWYLTFGIATVMLAVGLNAAPDSRLETWARKQAEKELEQELGKEIVRKPEWHKTI